MNNRQIIIPQAMQVLSERAGYAPAVKVGATLYCAGQVGRTPELALIEDPEQQFLAAWENLRLVLAAGGCGFADVVDMTTYHIDLQRSLPLFRKVKDRFFPGTAARGPASASVNSPSQACWSRSSALPCSPERLISVVYAVNQ